LFGEKGVRKRRKYLIGTVQGDVHELGKSIVIMMLRGNGWEVVDLGVDVSAEQFCAEVAKGDYQILGMSALLTMTMTNAARTIEALKERGLRDKIKIMVGGAPTTPEWANKIGADAHAKDGPSAAKIAAELIGRR
jgi:methylmalonyl-CoA mutase cobalamin-binding domain/chain